MEVVYLVVSLKIIDIVVSSVRSSILALWGGGQIFGEHVAGVNSHPFSVIDQNLDVTLIYHTLVPYMAVIFSKLSILVLTVQLLLIAKLISVDTIRNTKIYRGLKS